MTSAIIPGSGRFDPEPLGWKRDDEPGFVSLFGPVWVTRRDGVLRHGLVLEPHHLNRSSKLHGGMILAFFDHAMGLVGHEANGGGMQVTVQLDTHFIGAAVEGEFVEAQGRVVRKTGSLLFMAGTCTSGDRLIATAQGVWKIMKS